MVDRTKKTIQDCRLVAAGAYQFEKILFILSV